MFSLLFAAKVDAAKAQHKCAATFGGGTWTDDVESEQDSGD